MRPLTAASAARQEEVGGRLLLMGAKTLKGDLRRILRFSERFAR